MDIISKNPYRYLGVYSNSPTRERVANRGRMNAFLNVGKPVTFPLDLPDILPAIDRTVDSVADAESKLTLPVDQVRYAQFWWMNVTPLDDMAFNHLLSGNAAMARSIWEKKDNVSSLQNRLVLSLQQGDVVSAIRYSEPLYSQYADDFQRTILGDGVNTAAILWKTFLDTLLEEGLQIPATINSEWKSYVSEKTVGPLIEELTNAIATAKASRGKGCNARLAAGQKLMTSTRNTLSQLKKSLSTSDIRYQAIADKLANEILQCGIDYNNDSDDDDCAEKAMKLHKYALSVAVGQIAKDRCKENVDSLQKKIDSLPPSSVKEQYGAIMEALNKFARLPKKIIHARHLLKVTKGHFSEMKSIIGSTHKAYLKLSTIVVNAAFSNLIDEVNDASKDTITSYLDSRERIERIKYALQEAWKVTILMDEFDMEPDFKSNRYAENRQTLKNLCERLGVTTSSWHYPSDRPSVAQNPSTPRSYPGARVSRMQAQIPKNKPTASSHQFIKKESSSWQAALIVHIIFCIIGSLVASSCNHHDAPVVFFVFFAIGTLSWLSIALFDMPEDYQGCLEVIFRILFPIGFALIIITFLHRGVLYILDGLKDKYNDNE